MQRLTFCQDTYLDALTWTQDRRDAEMRGMCDFLRNNYRRDCPEAIDPVIEEMRAIRYAEADLNAGEVHLVL